MFVVWVAVVAAAYVKSSATIGMELPMLYLPTTEYVQSAPKSQ